MAILVSKYFEIEIDRYSQSPFIMFKGQRDHQDESVRKAQEFIEQNFHDKITVDQLSALFAVGRRSFERRFKKATSNTVTEYIQRVKIEAAKKSFETSRKNINEIMWEVGYSDTKAFRTVFKKTTGLSPLEYKNRYNRESVGTSSY
jgi:transcriptional regulator GlxA family with amidase domain